MRNPGDTEGCLLPHVFIELSISLLSRFQSDLEQKGDYEVLKIVKQLRSN